MNNSEQVYESTILKLAINKYLDQKLINHQKDLKTFELNKDEIVWDVVTKIYSQSGYKVSMSFARDIIDQRIKDIKDQLKKDEEKAHQEMIKIKAEQEKARIEKQSKINNFLQTLPEELNFDETKIDMFMRLHKVCCEHYYCYEYSNQDENDNLDDEELLNNELFMKILEAQIFTTTLYEGGLSNFTKVSRPEQHKWHTYRQVWEICGCDGVETAEFLMALEEEFEIEITDSESHNLVYMKDVVDCIYTKTTTS